MKNTTLKHFSLSAVFLFLFTCLQSVSATPKGSDYPAPASSAKILDDIKKLNVLGSVLYLAAHPDDENTRLISWFANDQKVKTAYLSLTRGDGGQNLIGTEKGELIGVLRTQELLEARKTDGGTQFFTRAVDFGYSKTTKETLEKWDEDAVLWDMVWVIRKFKPNVIVTRFPPNKYAGHGHHSASAVLAEKAFDMAADPKVFPEQLKHVTAWKTKRLYHNTSVWWDKTLKDTYASNPDVIRMDVGSYNATTGKWNNQIAMESRSQHKSQGFGANILRGQQYEYLKYVKGDKANTTIFDGIDLTWGKLHKTKNIQNKLDDIIDNFNANNPASSVDDLIELYRLLEEYPYTSFWIDQKKEALKNIIRDASGIWMEAVCADEYTTAGSTINVTASIINAGSLNSITLDSISFPGKDTAVFGMLDQNQWQKFKTSITIPSNSSNTHPYWLQEPYQNLFKVDDPLLRGLPENPKQYVVKYQLTINDLKLNYEQPIEYKWRDRVSGENLQDFSIRPDLTVNLDNSVYVCPTNGEKTVTVTVINHKANLTGRLSLDLPNGWKATPADHIITLNKKGTAAVYTFTISPNANAASGSFVVQCKVGEQIHNRALVEIDYPHIHKQTLFPVATGKLVTGQLAMKSKRIGYVMGAGDNVPEAIEQLGGQIELIIPKNIAAMDLSKFDAIVAGIRSYNTQKELAQYQEIIMNYVDSGGLFIVQYNTNHGLKTKDLGPYPFKLSRARVTDEFARPNLLDPNHAIFNYPNKIQPEDFNHWVQERGLYFSDEWDEKYTPLIQWNDPGEEPNSGSLLVTNYGKGKFIFTGISFFRQLPAGVPGAFKLFANILSYGK